MMASRLYRITRRILADPWSNLAAAPLRSALALPGIVIGTAAVVALINISANAAHQSRSQFAAIGASPCRIAAQFLAETALLAVLGAAVGLLLGHVIGYAVARFVQWEHVVAWSAFPAAAGMSLVVALGAGLYPALRAANMDPAQALRSD